MKADLNVFFGVSSLLDGEVASSCRLFYEFLFYDYLEWRDMWEALGDVVLEVNDISLARIC